MQTRICRPRRGLESVGVAETYRITCSEGHVTNVDLDNLEEVLDSFSCAVATDEDDDVDDGEVCGAGIDACEPEDVALECQFCGSSDWVHWTAVDLSCDQCPGEGPVEGARLFSGTYGARVDLATDMYDFELETGWQKERPDHWECVTHFTTPEAFSQILKARRIQARRTGYYGLPAVCLTEVPIAWTAALQAKFGSFGFMFFKRDLLRAGAAPVINLPPSMITHRIPDTIKPLLNKIDEQFNFLHEREWRAPSDVDLQVVAPMLVLPEKPMESLYAHMSPEELGAACSEFGVVEYWQPSEQVSRR